MDINKAFGRIRLWINTLMQIAGLIMVLTQASVAASNGQASPTQPASSVASSTWVSVDRIINLVLLGIIILLIIVSKRSCNLQNRELDRLKKELEQAPRKQLESVDEHIEQQPSKPKRPKNLAETMQPSRYRIKKQPHFKNQAVEAIAETIQLQNTSTILNTASVLDLQREQRTKEILSLYRAMIENLRPNDFKNFCQQQHVSNAKQMDSNSSRETILELIEDQPCNEAELWAIPIASERYLILPGAIMILDCNALHVENAHMLRKIFRGIMMIVPSSNFELIKPSLAEKRANTLIITSMGKLGLPLEAKKR